VGAADGTEERDQRREHGDCGRGVRKQRDGKISTREALRHDSRAYDGRS
jgi:hypothetical protein